MLMPCSLYFQKPPCAGQIHDTVLSKSTLTVVITVHVIPIIICIYLLIRNLKSNKLEHLFLYIESVPPSNTMGGMKRTALEQMEADGKNNNTLRMGNGIIGVGIQQQQQHADKPTLKETLNDLLVGFNVKFVPKKY